MKRIDCERLDEDCRLTKFRERFSLPGGVLYFDGNSLGALPKSTSGTIRELIDAEWGQGLIRSWLGSEWLHLSQRAGDAIAPLVGASKGEVVVSDSTSVCLFKLAASLLRHGRSGRKVVTERGNFPTDIYVLEGAIGLLDKGHELVFAEPERITDAVDEQSALVLLTHVDFRTGALHDMEAITAHCRERDVPVIWDLSHSAGAVPVELNRWKVEYAVGCTYKFLNGGPGAPAFTYVSAGAVDTFEPVVSGWFGHAHPFGFEDRFRPASSIDKCLVGTPPILSLRAVLDGVGCFDGVDLGELVEKSRRLSELFIELADDRLARHGLELASPRDSGRRGSQVSFTHPEAYSISRALVARNVIPDFRDPDILRFGITPLYTRYIDVWDCIAALETVMSNRIWERFRTETRAAVT